ncbi:N-6 DNA methylase [Vibrio fluvialis]|jgi:predicted RNA methylase|uniref:N-6 DNA methylase n=1 Tax=Vibrio fluvialis TaxID=676 RepID=UPI00192B777F|nr:N-6 DNA methylase [Vibrio fluvialis]GHX26148.1 putative Type I restriction-modification system methyltransferase subunit [Vibrio cholerae]ELI5737918.1 N-6 DNA methylase [Vibrio fluvialis]MBL4297893.1 N-6 DNA methylase [Vibrio fluvialis]MBY7869402.1 N-6 DNA methylase [Vibrio fluvialis]MBY8022698.1 N-6 DNA methylase [Vibrio fluvialis]
MKQQLSFIQKREIFSQFYTKKEISDYLCDLLVKGHSLKNVVDLGVGEGSLLNSIKSTYGNIKTVGVDIDKENIRNLYELNNIDSLYCFDSTKIRNVERLIYKHGTFDLVVGNPPYNRISIDEEIKNTFKSLNIYDNRDLSKIGSDIVFLIHGLLLLNDLGTLVYILPDGFSNNIFYKELRKFLYENYRVNRIVEIPEKSFVATEAKTHLISISKGMTSDIIEVSRLDGTKTINISKEQFIARCDYSFLDKPLPMNYRMLKDFNVRIFRGNRSKCYLSKAGVAYVHTSNMADISISKNENIKDFDGVVVTKKGDIAIARVGTRVVGNYSLIERDNFVVSDCIIIIRSLDKITRDRILRSLNMDVTKAWINSIKKGVGAKHITIKDLMELPIY